jgi:murein DD-endopeptidase MepM/ murein hydrolase activator NlpD
MTRKALGGIVASILGLVVACAAGATLLFGGGTGGACTMPMPTGSAAISAPPGGWRPVGRFDVEQVGHAATITVVGAQLGVPIRGWIIAVATAIQESDLRNVPGGPDDSIGLFQQRSSQGWGTPDQLRDPVYAAGKFYERLLTVANWQQMALTDAAQAVQRSAYPDAYADDEPDATLLVSTVGSANWRAIPENLEQCVSNGEWTQPVLAPIVSGFRTAARPGHDGVDLGASRGTPIRAASAGTVVVVRCNVTPADWGCNRDGSPSTPGCGWYVDITHAGDIITRYCHMLARPSVTEGQQVLAGQVIGVVGSSGHSSGPHLHFEVHLHGDRTSVGAVDPVGWMRDHGAPIGMG